jgi:hypothetical protein
MSAHHAFVYAVELTEDELKLFEQRQHQAIKNPDGGEITYIEILSIEQLLGDQRADWSMIGMILSVVTTKF